MAQTSNQSKPKESEECSLSELEAAEEAARAAVVKAYATT
jgi:hypothetical protein